MSRIGEKTRLFSILTEMFEQAELKRTVEWIECEQVKMGFLPTTSVRTYFAIVRNPDFGQWRPYFPHREFIKSDVSISADMLLEYIINNKLSNETVQPNGQ